MTLISTQVFSVLLFSPLASVTDLIPKELRGRACAVYTRIRRVTVINKSAPHLGSRCLLCAARPRSSLSACVVYGKCCIGEAMWTGNAKSGAFRRYHTRRMTAVDLARCALAAAGTGKS